MFKLVVVGPEERVVGVHIIGMGSDEALQGFAVAVKMGGEQDTFGGQIFFDDGVVVYSDEARIRRHGGDSPDLRRGYVSILQRTALTISPHDCVFRIGHSKVGYMAKALGHASENVH